jgi:hypothetical protein
LVRGELQWKRSTRIASAFGEELKMHPLACVLALAACGQFDVNLPPAGVALPAGIEQPAGPLLVPAAPGRPAVLRSLLPRIMSSSHQPPVPTPMVETLPPMSVPAVPGQGAEAVALYHRVRYEDPRNIAPCAVPMVVSVRDPCDTCCGKRDCCCPRNYVFIQICVPPCGCPKVKESRCGFKVSYDYGKYQIEITSRKGEVKVDYDD